MQSAKISIVIPSFNQGPYIEETIASIVGQNYSDLELIIMDGGSTDDTVSIIERYAEHLSYWVSAKDGGQADALHRGFARATGDILSWVNSDDALAPGALAAVAAAFSSGEADIVAGIANIRRAGRLDYHHRTGLAAGPLLPEMVLDLENEWLTGRFFYQPEVFFTRAIYQAAGGKIDRTLHYSMDYDLWLRLARAGARILPIDYELAEFRVHADQKTNTVEAYLPELTAHANTARLALALPAIAPSDPNGRPRRALKVGMLNDHGFRYGAGRAHRRLAECLAASHVEVVAYAFREGLDDTTTCAPDEAVEALAAAKVDVILVGNLHGAFPQGLDLAPFAAVAPLLMVTHDFFWLTGRCPYPMDCTGYLATCMPDCPTRDSYPVIPYEAIPEAHRLKLANLALPDVYLAANSAYMERAARHALGVQYPGLAPEAKVRRVCLPIPEPAFQPGGREAARGVLGLAPDEIMVLTVSSSVNDPRKRFQHVLDACAMVGTERIRLCAMGWVAPEERVKHVVYLGHFEDDEAIARCYRAADVFVSAAADETFGQTFIEAAMCGCPSIGYAVGAVPEVIVEGETGWLVPPGDVAALADRIRAIADTDRRSREALRRRAHLFATSRYGAPTFLAAFNDLLRGIVKDRDVKIATGAQYGGALTLPVRMLERRRIVLGEGFAPVEGPFPELGVFSTLQWQVAPRATMTIHVPVAGKVLLRLIVANPFLAQELTVTRGQDVLARIALPREGWDVSHEIALVLDVPLGETRLVAAAPAGFMTAERVLYLAFQDARLEPTEAAVGLRAPRRVERGSGKVDVTADDGFESPEGPFPQFGIERKLQWQVRPQATLTVRARARGLYLLTLAVAQPFVAQDVTILRGQTILARFSLEPESWTVHHEIAIALELPAGETTLSVKAPDGLETTERILYLAFYDAKLEPTTGLAGLRHTERLDASWRTRDVTADDGFGAPEGPFPDLDIERTLQWQVQPKGTLTLRARKKGLFLLTLAVAQPLIAQSVTIAREQDVLARFDLEPDSWAVHHEIALVLELPAGETMLTVSAPRYREVDGRRLHLVLFEARLKSASVAQQTGILRRVEAKPIHHGSGLSSGHALQPDLYVTQGFSTVEGPYPELGVPMRLAWQTERVAHLRLATNAARQVLALDVHVPCDQVVNVTIGGMVHTFTIARDEWMHPTRLLLPFGSAAGEWQGIELSCEAIHVDDAGRPLRLALLGAETVTDREGTSTTRYGPSELPLVVMTAVSA